MENQTTTPKQIMLNYGLVLGLTSILINVIIFAIGKTYDPHWSVGVLGFIIMIVILVLGIKKMKEINGGYLGLGEALKIGLGIALISALISVIYTLIFTNYIEPEYFTRMAEVQQQKMLEAYPNFTDEQLEASMAMTKKMSGPFVTSAMTIIGSLFFGFIIALIGGLVMKKTNEEIDSI
ncbi:hypothetical protein Lupro_03935 [Lutibacter profundi]|uniref:DUF4199 domain-containing protein n=1 Tax=Lutibacter profundi TaxID=1622118 RepID=A0A0X8G5I0_9FLAO|nr:DUF4199 domain-containing protein [Lutibacter profundi]AMC10453.1 hypothetical protein Lupro_03935 [Lutibacter profundi]